MPFNYRSPGVYVEEIDKGARPIESAATSVLALIGFTPENIIVEKNGKPTMQSTPSTPTLVTNLTDFANTFGDYEQRVDFGYLHDAVFGYFLNGGANAYIVGLPLPVKLKSKTPQLPRGEGYLLTAGGARTVRLTTVGPLKEGDDISAEVQPADPPGDGTFALKVRRAGTEKIIPNLSLNKGRGQRSIADVLTKETDNLLAAEMLDLPGTATERMPAVGSKTTLTVIVEPPAPAISPQVKQKVTRELFRGNAADRLGLQGLEAVEDITLVACPDVMAAYEQGLFTEEDVKAVQTEIIDHCEMMKDRFAILDMPKGLGVQDAIAWRKDKMNFDTKFAAMYYPWLQAPQNPNLIPPSGYAAGVYARVDSERGIHKAPANEKVRGILGLEKNVSRNEQDNLNPIGVNCIRSFPGLGIRIWGARTLSSDGQWRYINVRRLFSNVEESILQGTNWIVFEPNDQYLWSSIKRDIGAYLTVVWRSGALFGATAEEAFYVKCDAETNPKELRDLGYCIIEVGMAPVKPAEFVVFKISQLKDGAGSAAE